MKLIVICLCIAAAVASEPRWLIIPEAEVALVQQSWAQVKSREVDILYSIFKQYPDLQAQFPAFVGKDLDGLRDTGAFALHAGRIISFFTSYIDLLGKESTQPAIKTLLNELGSSHKTRGISKAQFNEFEQGLLAFLRENVSWGANVEKAYEDVFDKAYYVIFSNLDGNAVQ